MDGFVWLAHPETGNKAQFSAEAAEIWRKRGWEDADAPAPVDPTTAHLTEAAPVADEQTTPGSDAPPPAEVATKTSRRSSGNEQKEAAE